MGGEITLRDTLYGAGSGLAGLLGLVFLFKALAVGPMAAVSPLTAFVGAIVPFSIGLLGGERPSALALTGATFGLIAVPLVSGFDRAPEHRPARSTMVMAALAGVGFGGFFALIAQIDEAAGLWPLIPAKLTAIVVLGTILLARRDQPGAPPAAARWAYASGFIDMLANIFFLLASQIGLLSITGVISSLYPAVTVGLGRVFLKERLSFVQIAGVGLVIAALGLIAYDPST
jgi:drug/metabolite transporter (DMT)-like permease